MYYAVFIFFLISISGDCVGALHGKRFGEMTPITVLGIGMLVYVSGLFEKLYLGFILVLVITVSMYVYCLGYLIVKKKWKEFFKHFLTRTFFLYAGVCALFAWGDYRQQTIEADDLGHWMDCVKSMVWSGKFYTADTFSASTFPTYPPFIGLIQYVGQMAWMKLLGGGFLEGLLLYILHSMIVILCLPFVASIEENGGKWISTVASMISIVLMVTVLFPYIVNRAMIDPVLSVAAAVMFVLIVEKDRIRHSTVYLGLLLPALVLMKDLGLLFSVFGLILLAVISVREKKYGTLALPVLATAAAKGSWAMVIARYNAVDPKPASVDWLRYTKALLGLFTYEEEYKNISIANYRSALANQEFRIEYRLINISMPYWLVIVLVLLGFLAFLIYERRHEAGRIDQSNRSYRINGIVLVGMLVAFWFGLGGIYADRFIEQEAISLASYGRYYNTVIGVVLFELILLLLMNSCYWKCPRLVIIIPVILCLVFPAEYCLSYVKQEYYRYASGKRADANRFAEEMTETCDQGSRMYLVSQSKRGWWDYLISKFMIRPYLALQPISSDEYNWYFVEEKDPGDPYSIEMDRAAWEEILFDSDTYDYVAITEVDDYFIHEFSPLFETEEIMARSIYRVDKENRSLILVYSEGT